MKKTFLYLFICAALTTLTAQDYIETVLHASDAVANDEFGAAASISGTRAVIGATHVDDGEIENSGAVYVFDLVEGTWTQSAKIVKPTAELGAQFGNAVTFNDQFVIVGAWNAGTAGLNSGSVYIFEETMPGTWMETAAFASPDDNSEGDHFGYAVDFDGQHLVVGAHLDEENGENSGAVFVYKYDAGWSEPMKLVASDAAEGDQFGNAVAVAGDYIVVAARTDDYHGRENAGSAYIFQLIDGEWTEIAKLIDEFSEGSGDHFAYDIDFDGETLVVGHYQNDFVDLNCGAVHVYESVSGGNTWTRTAFLTHEDGNVGDEFGYSVAVDGDYIVVGAHLDDAGGQDAGSAFLYKFDGMQWNEVTNMSASNSIDFMDFGSDVAVSDGTVLIGAQLANENESGSGYIYTEDSSVGIDGNGEIATGFSLKQNYPNPFNPTTTIAFNLPQAGPVTLKVFDVLGNELRTITDGFTAAGEHSILFDASDLPTGVYMYRLTMHAQDLSALHVQTRKMILIK